MYEKIKIEGSSTINISYLASNCTYMFCTLGHLSLKPLPSLVDLGNKLWDLGRNLLPTLK